MPAQDFNDAIDGAASLVLDATCACRNAARRPLPHPHRRLLACATRKLEGAQDDLFRLRNDPWSPPPKPPHQQLELAA